MASQRSVASLPMNFKPKADVELQIKAIQQPSYIELDPAESARVAHAKELLGNSYQRSVVRHGEQVQVEDYKQFINQWLIGHLSDKWKPQSRRIADAIMDESQRYAFDPIFLMAVIENESKFNPDIVGTSGELGLMQILPDTGKWIATKFDFKWKGPASLKDPVTSIRIGSAFLAHLRERFDFHGRLYLAAYNMGIRNVNRNLARQVWPKTYSNRVMAKYIHFYTEVTDSSKIASAN